MSRKQAKNDDINRRSRNFVAVLYPDCEEHQKAIEALINGEYKAVGALHDKDIYTTESETHKAGEYKKKHYHFVIHLQEAKTRTAFADCLGINATALEPCRDKNGAYRYLLHLDDDDKYQYDRECLVGSMAADISKKLDDTPEAVKAQRICNLIDSLDSYISPTSFTALVNDEGLYSTLKRNNAWFRYCLQEHNRKYQKCGAL